jgi:hypothetical protein
MIEAAHDLTAVVAKLALCDCLCHTHNVARRATHGNRPAPIGISVRRGLLLPELGIPERHSVSRSPAQFRSGTRGPNCRFWSCQSDRFGRFHLTRTARRPSWRRMPALGDRRRHHPTPHTTVRRGASVRTRCELSEARTSRTPACRRAGRCPWRPPGCG